MAVTLSMRVEKVHCLGVLRTAGSRTGMNLLGFLSSMSSGAHVLEARAASRGLS